MSVPPRRGRPRATADSKARAARIAAALADLLEDVPVAFPPGEAGDPYRDRPTGAAPPRPRALVCPGCLGRLRLEPQRGIEIHVCEQCHGLWLDPGELEAMAASSAEPNRVPDVAELRQHMRDVTPPTGEVRYRLCPRCRDVMHRRNYGSMSGVIVDECSRHGVYLDPGELDAIETFIHMGGLALQRARIEERVLEQQRKAAHAQPEHVTTTQPVRARTALLFALFEILFA